MTETFGNQIRREVTGLKSKLYFFLTSALLFSSILHVTGCKKRPTAEKGSSQPSEVQRGMAGEDQHIQVQHILIGFAGSLPGKKVDRNQAQAEKLADEVFAKAKSGDFDALVKQYTDDSAPGIYGMSNRGVAPEAGEFGRESMVPAFGDIGFSLKVGEIAVAKYDPAKSPFGYHIIKRLK
jgi:hypothetical protein